MASEHPAEFRWSNARAESASQDELNARDGDDAVSPAPLDQSTTGEAAWGRPAGAADVWHSADAEVSTSDSAPEPTSDAWSNEFASGPQQKNQTPGARKFRRKRRLTPARLGRTTATVWQNSQWKIRPRLGNLRFGRKPRSSQEVSLSSQFSLSRKKRSSKRLSRRAAQRPNRNRRRSSSDILTCLPKMALRAKQSRTVRTSWLNHGQSRQSSRDRRKPVWLLRVKRKTRLSNTWRSCCNGCAAMHRAVRLQRHNLREVRSTRPDGTTKLARLSVQRHWHIPSPAGVADSEIAATETQSTESPTPAKRKVSSPAPQTDLGALRALANETARRAISRHELRKHRRNAVTKVIVATLAGVTSLWLMLDSPALV